MCLVYISDKRRSFLVWILLSEDARKATGVLLWYAVKVEVMVIMFVWLVAQAQLWLILGQNPGKGKPSCRPKKGGGVSGSRVLHLILKAIGSSTWPRVSCVLKRTKGKLHPNQKKQESKICHYNNFEEAAIKEVAVFICQITPLPTFDFIPKIGYYTGLIIII